MSQSRRISPFWNALVASAVFIITALILDDYNHAGKIIIFEGVLFGVKGADEMIKNYNISRKNE